MAFRYRYRGRLLGGVVAPDVGPLDPGEEFVTAHQLDTDAAELLDDACAERPGTVFRPLLDAAKQQGAAPEGSDPG